MPPGPRASSDAVTAHAEDRVQLPRQQEEHEQADDRRADHDARDRDDRGERHGDRGSCHGCGRHQCLPVLVGNRERELSERAPERVRCAGAFEIGVELGHRGAVLASEAARVEPDQDAIRPRAHQALRRRAFLSSVSSRATSAARTRAPRAVHAVVAAALVVDLRVGPLGGLLDQAVGEHALHRAVERARAHGDGVVGEHLDLAHDRVAVHLLVPRGRGGCAAPRPAGEGSRFRLRSGRWACAPISVCISTLDVSSNDTDGRRRCQAVPMAEGEGFEPSRRLNTPYSLSRRALSAAQSSLRWRGQV